MERNSSDSRIVYLSPATENIKSGKIIQFGVNY